MQQSDARPICGDIIEMPFDWRPPETSNSLLYAKHSVFKSHVELVGPNGLVKSKALRLGLYGMLPNSEYGVRTHPAEDIYIYIYISCLRGSVFGNAEMRLIVVKGQMVDPITPL